jgi:hypothetical protein
MCGPPPEEDQDGLGAGETVIQGTVLRGGAPVSGAYVRLLDHAGEFTGEVRTSSGGRFRFFAAPGEWTVQALAPGATGRAVVLAEAGEVTPISVLVD